MVLVAVHYGLGWKITQVAAQNFDKVLILMWIYNIINILALAFTMISVALLMNRITMSKKVKRCTYGLVVATTLWAIACVLVLAFKCNLPTPWLSTQPDRCLDVWSTWLGSTIVNGLIEACLLKVAVFLVWDLNMPRKTKVKVLMAFATRLLVLLPTFVRLKYIHAALHGTDYTYDRIDASVLTQITMHVSIILATVPCAKPFFAVFEGGIFRSPPDPASKKSFSSSRVSSFHTGASRTVEADGSRTQAGRPKPQPVLPITWNHRDTWAKPSKNILDSFSSDPARKKSHSRLNPFGWNRRVTFQISKKPPSSMAVPLRGMDSPMASSSRSRGVSSRTSSPRSSRYTAISKLPRAALLQMKSRDSSTNTEQTETPSAASRRRRQSSTDFWLGLSNEDGHTVTTVYHDPEDAESREQRRIATTAERHPGRTGQMESSHITPDLEREEEDAMAAVGQARSRREEAAELRRKGRFGIEQTQSFHVSYDTMRPDWGCCGTHGLGS